MWARDVDALSINRQSDTGLSAIIKNTNIPKVETDEDV